MVLHCCLKRNFKFGFILSRSLNLLAPWVLIAAAGILLLFGKLP